jgi:hypothetical protein
MSRHVLQVVLVHSFASISQETIEYVVFRHSTSFRTVLYFWCMSSAANYRIYELTIGNQVAGSRTIVCDSDQNAIEKAKKMLDERDLEIRHGARLVARLRVADNK